jgi:hypothetical protein
MSQENLELVREIWRAFERFEFPAEAFDEGVEWHTAADLRPSRPWGGNTHRPGRAQLETTYPPKLHVPNWPKVFAPT